MIAYLDAGTASVVIAAIAGGVGGVRVALKTYGQKLAFWRKSDTSAAAAIDDRLDGVSDDALIDLDGDIDGDIDAADLTDPAEII